MQLTLQRFQQGTCFTGTLSVDGLLLYYTLDPGDIPAGTYNLTKYASPDHGGDDVLLVNDVPGHSYIEMHVGNIPADTDGCVLVGMGYSGLDYVSSSAIAVAALYASTFPVLAAGGTVSLTVADIDTSVPAPDASAVVSPAVGITAALLGLGLGWYLLT